MNNRNKNRMYGKDDGPYLKPAKDVNMFLSFYLYYSLNKK